MLMLKPGCECCDVDLPPDSDEAMIQRMVEADIHRIDNGITWEP